MGSRWLYTKSAARPLFLGRPVKWPQQWAVVHLPHAVMPALLTVADVWVDLSWNPCFTLTPRGAQSSELDVTWLKVEQMAVCLNVTIQFPFHFFLFCVALTMRYNVCQMLNPQPFRHPTYLCIVCWSIAFLIWCNFISIIKTCLFRFFSRSFMLTFLYDHFILQRHCMWNYSWFICNQWNSVTKWQKAQIALRWIENIWRKCWWKRSFQLSWEA